LQAASSIFLAIAQGQEQEFTGCAAYWKRFNQVVTIVLKQLNQSQNLVVAG